MSLDTASQLERLVRVSPQRWLLAAIAVASGTGASVITGVTGGGLPPVLVMIVGAASVVSAVRPDTHSAVVVIAIVVWQWLAVADDLLGPAVLAVSLSLFVFHTSIALMAAAPSTARLEPDILRRWSERVALVALATAATWGLVLLMDQRRAAGSTALTLAGFLAALTLVAVLLHRFRRVQT